jgi:drug/metabolite transporter (DMT)-like permease
VIFFGALQAIVYYFSYLAFEKGSVSVLSPIFASFAGLVALFSFLLFGDSVNVAFLPALVLIFGGVMLINSDIENIKTWRFRIKGVDGLKEIVIATILATVWTLGWGKFTKNGDWISYTTLMFLFMTISAFLTAKYKKVDLLDVQKDAWKFLWFIAIGEVVAYLAITLGYGSTKYTSIVAILSGASSLPTIILARVFLKEKMRKIQIVASVFVILGIVFISLN